MDNKTVSGLPKSNLEVPAEFEVIRKFPNAFFYKFPFVSAYTMWKAEITLQMAAGHVSQVKTCLIYQHEIPLMYAFVIDEGKKYILTEIGSNKIYRVSKSDIQIEPVKHYRQWLCALVGNGDAIVEMNDKNRIYAIFYRFENGKEVLLKKFFFPATEVRAYHYLERKKLR